MTDEATSQKYQHLSGIRETKGKKPSQNTQPAIFHDICFSDVIFDVQPEFQNFKRINFSCVSY